MQNLSKNNAKYIRNMMQCSPKLMQIVVKNKWKQKTNAKCTLKINAKCSFIHFWLRFASYLVYILYYFWTTFCIGVQFSHILYYVLHYFWTTLCIMFKVHFTLVFPFYSLFTTFCIICGLTAFIHFGLRFALVLDYIFH